MTVGSGYLLAQDTGGYHQKHEYKLGGDTGWDYLTMDAGSRRLYISRGTHVQVINIESGKPEGDTTDLKGVHGIAPDKANTRSSVWRNQKAQCSASRKTTS